MIHKPSVHWQRITEVLPQPDQQCLVWTGEYMYVARADFYDEECLKDVQEELKQACLQTKGRFKDFGVSHYFTEKNVFWSPIPLAPGEHNPPSPDPFEGMISKDAYLKKDGVIVGIHAIGHPGLYEWVNVAADGTETKHTSNFMQMEIWGNEYDENHHMLGRGSFRVFDHFENEVRNWEADGWVRYEGPKKVTK